MNHTPSPDDRSLVPASTYKGLLAEMVSERTTRNCPCPLEILVIPRTRHCLIEITCEDPRARTMVTR